MEEFSAFTCIRFGWETFKKRPWFFIGITLLISVLGLLAKAIGNGLWSGSAAGYPDLTRAALSGAVTFLLGTLIDIGGNALALKAHDAPEAARVSDLWHPRSYLNYLLAVVAVGVISVVGLMLLIIPGIFAILTFFFVKYLVIEGDLSAIEAMRESARIVRGHRIPLLVLLLLVLLLNLLGMLLFFVGLLLSIPVTMLASVHAYRLLARGAQASTRPPA